VRLFVNPYTGQVFDYDAIQGVQVGTAQGGKPVVAVFCPTTGKPLNDAAVDAWAYPGPATDRELWAADARAVVAKVQADVAAPNAASLGVVMPAVELVGLDELRAQVAKLEAAAVVAPAPGVN